MIKVSLDKKSTMLKEVKAALKKISERELIERL
jgi:hypothetical protein